MPTTHPVTVNPGGVFYIQRKRLLWTVADTHRAAIVYFCGCAEYYIQKLFCGYALLGL